MLAVTSDNDEPECIFLRGRSLQDALQLRESYRSPTVKSQQSILLIG
jgi:hypothetical protein